MQCACPPFSLSSTPKAEATSLLVTTKDFNIEVELLAILYITCWRWWWDRLGKRSQSRLLFFDQFSLLQEAENLCSLWGIYYCLSVCFQAHNHWMQNGTLSDSYCSVSNWKKTKPTPVNQPTKKTLTLKKSTSVTTNQSEPAISGLLSPWLPPAKKLQQVY